MSVYIPPVVSEAHAEVVILSQEKTETVEAKTIVHALRTMEGGNFHAKGASGETGAFQFTAPTWRAYSKEVFGEVREQTEETELQVVSYKVQSWLDEGYTARDIFLFWNQGHNGPCSSGVNKHGVKYDSCAYAEKGMGLI